MLKRLDRVLYRVPQIEGAVRYYRDTLGMRLLRQDKSVASFALQDGAELVLHSDSDLPDQAIYLLVDDVRELYRRRDELKLKFNSAPTPGARGFRATVKDSFGNVLLLLDRSADTNGTQAIEDGKCPGALFAGVAHKVPAKREV